MFNKKTVQKRLRKVAKNVPTRRQMEMKVKRVFRDTQKQLSKGFTFMPIKITFGR